MVKFEWRLSRNLVIHVESNQILKVEALSLVTLDVLLPCKWIENALKIGF